MKSFCFFFSKNFYFLVRGNIRALAGNVEAAEEVKVFCFFFSKKKAFFLSS